MEARVLRGQLGAGGDWRCRMTAIIALMARMRERLRGLLFRARLDAEMEEELRFHMEMEARKLDGAGHADASRLAAARLGGVERYKDEVRDARGLAWIPGMRLDFALGLRMMKKHPALSIVGGIGIAVGVAMTVGMFVFIRANVYPTIPLDEGDRIVALENRDVTVNNEDRRVIHDFVTWRRELKSIEDIGAFQTVVKNMSVGNEPPEPVTLAEMTAAGFTVARVPALMGRYLLPEDERADAPAVVVIGYDTWVAKFGSAPDVVGRSIRLGRVMHTIVGVMPEGFAFPMLHGMWVPLRAEAVATASKRRQGPWLFVFGRLAPGATLESAQVELSLAGKRAAAQFPENARLEPMVMPYIHSLTDIQGIETLAIVMMQAMMTLLLVVVAVNVAMLVYARTATRQGEIAVRTALGASRTRIVSQLFIEALALALVSSAAGLGLGYFGVSFGAGIMEAEAGGSPFWVSYRLDPVVVLYTLGIAVFTAVVVGVLPALQTTGKQLQVNLRSLGGSALRLGRTWTTLIIAQVALAVAVLPATVNFAWTEMRGAMTHTVYDADRFLFAELQSEGPEKDAPVTTRPDGDKLAEIVRRIEQVPDIEAVAYRTSFANRRGPVEVEGVVSPPGARGFRVISNAVAPNYLSLYALNIVAGRNLAAADMDTASTAMVVSRAFAAKVFGTANPVGRRLRFAGSPPAGDTPEKPASRWFEIVGVAENERANEFNPELVIPEMYYAVSPATALLGESIVIEARTRGPFVGSIVPAIRQAVAQVDPALQIARVVQQSTANRQDMTIVRLLSLGLGLVLVSVFLLSAAGIYSLVSFTVTRRRKEIGIRSALGATQRQVMTAILWPVARQILIGMVIGIAGAAVIDRASGQELFGGRAGLLLPTFGVLMSIVALLAAFGPARRGILIQPTEALRAEA